LPKLLRVYVLSVDKGIRKRANQELGCLGKTGKANGCIFLLTVMTPPFYITYVTRNSSDSPASTMFAYGNSGNTAAVMEATQTVVMFISEATVIMCLFILKHPNAQLAHLQCPTLPIIHVLACPKARPRIFNETMSCNSCSVILGAVDQHW